MEKRKRFESSRVRWFLETQWGARHAEEEHQLRRRRFCNDTIVCAPRFLRTRMKPRLAQETFGSSSAAMFQRCGFGCAVVSTASLPGFFGPRGRHTGLLTPVR